MWLIALAVFSFASSVPASGLSSAPGLFAYDGQNQVTMVYDGGFPAVFDYDSAAVLRAGEEANPTSGASSLFGKIASFLAAEATVARNPNVYEALYEAPISGTSRAAQRASANDFFANQLQNDAQLNSMFNQELGGNVLEHMESSSGSSYLNPPGTVWHHPFDNPNVMIELDTPTKARGMPRK